MKGSPRGRRSRPKNLKARNCPKVPSPDNGRRSRRKVGQSADFKEYWAGLAAYVGGRLV